MSLVGSVSLTNNKDGLYLGKVNIQNMEANNNEILQLVDNNIHGVSLGDMFEITNNTINTKQLHTNSIYVNDGVNDIQNGVDTATQGDVVYVSSGSYGGSTLTITDKYNIAVLCPNVGNTICELNNRGLTVSGTSELIRIANLNIKGSCLIGGVGRYYFYKTNFSGVSGTNINVSIGSGVIKYMTFENCEFSYCNITIPNTLTSTIYFINCSFSNCVIVYNNTNALQVIMNNCSNLPSLTGNFTRVGLNVSSSGVSQVDAYNINLTNINGSPYVAGGGSNISINNQSDNRLITCSSSNNILDAETNLTWDGINKLGMITTNNNYIIGNGSISTGLKAVSVGVATVGNSSVGVGANSFIGNAGIVIGSDSGRSGVIGGYNCLVGYWCGRGLSTGGANLIVGSNAGQQISSGNNNVIIGTYSGDGQSSQSNNTIVGVSSNCSDGLSHYNNCSILGQGIQGVISGSNQVQLGNSLTQVYAYGYNTRSDLRDKNHITDTSLGLNFIEKLHPVEFKYNFREDYVETIINPETHEITTIRNPNDGSKTRSRYHQGLIAQEVKNVCDILGIDFGGFQDHKINGGSDVYTLNYIEFIAPMIKALKELSEKVKNLELQINQLQK